MATIAAIGTATQICEWMGVPDPAIRHVTQKLHEAGLTPVIDGQREVSAPRYNTAEAFELYTTALRQPLPPEAKRLLLAARIKREQEKAKGLPPVEIPTPLVGGIPLPLTPKRSPRIRSRNSPEQLKARHYAHSHGLVTKEDIGERFGKLNVHGFLSETFRHLLARKGLKPFGQKVGRISIYHPMEVDSAARNAGIEVPDEPWACFSDEAESTVGGASSNTQPAKLLSLAEFLEGKELDGSEINPRDHAEIEIELNTQYQLRTADGRDGVKLYAKRDLTSAWRRYIADCT